MSQRIIAHYQLTSKLGEGGMGEVYRATDTKLGRDVAIKVIPEIFARDADRMARFTREAKVLASLNHPNIAAIHGVEDCALIMELVEGPTLQERIRQGSIPLAEALAIARQITEALEYAHDKGIVHRDLKPANIKVTPEGRVKVLDFGLAKALATEPVAGNPASSPTLTMEGTRAGVILGTAAYMSPEQARGAMADRRSDVWSFGVVFFEMLTGRRMFAAETVSDTLAAVLRADPDWSALPADTPPGIRRLLRRCLERDRGKRLADIADARLEVDEPMTGSGESSARHEPAGLRWLTAAVSLIALAGAAVAVLHFRESPPTAVPMRFQIPAPEKTTFGNFGIALSPDGRQLAFIARNAAGQPMLWVRKFDSLAAEVLPGTEGVSFHPFWSPDSRFLGFVVGGVLKKVEASGGPPQTLTEPENPLPIVSASWSTAGEIAFGPAFGGLLRMPQAGGMSTTLTTPDSSQGEVGHLRPWFLPDGKHFLYFSRSQTQGTAIYLASLDGKARRRLVVSQQAGAYAPPAPGSDDGHLLFLRDGTLLAQRLDTKRLELAGEPFPVAEQVGSSLAMGFFSVSASGVLAYRSGGSGFSQLGWFDRQGNSLGTLGPPANYTRSLEMAPDGKRVAVDLLDRSGNADVWVLDVARGVPTRFTFSTGVDSMPVWSPGERGLTFSSSRIGVPAVYQKNFSGSEPEQLLLQLGTPCDWSPDGRTLLFTRFDVKTANDLWVAPAPAAATTGGIKPVPYLQTPFDERQGQFSPDGRWIAYSSNESGQVQVHVQSFPAGGGSIQVSLQAGGSQPRWRGDGKELFYVAADGKLMAVDVKTAHKFEAGAPKVLFDPHIIAAPGSNPYFRYDVTADGKRFLVNTSATLAENAVPTPITVVLNWQAAIKR